MMVRLLIISIVIVLVFVIVLAILPCNSIGHSDSMLKVLFILQVKCVI